MRVRGFGKLGAVFLVGGFFLSGCVTETPPEKPAPQVVAPKPPTPEPEQTALAPIPRNFQVWLEDFKAEARGRGIAEWILTTAFEGARPKPSVIKADRSQPEFVETFEMYRDKRVTASRINRGRELFQANEALLREIGSKYGVDPRFIVALWGFETAYGSFTGGKKVTHALATLAYDGRRSAYFRKELHNALLILQQGHITPDEMKGSWAGAMGQCQFMPSSFLELAQDYDGDGHRDIWNTEADVFASAANYLAHAGWKEGRNWGYPVSLPRGFNKNLASLKVRRSQAQWRATGVTLTDGSPLPDGDSGGSVIFSDKNDRGQAYVVFDNFRAVRRWNPSNFFALSVGHLADAIARR